MTKPSKNEEKKLSEVEKILVKNGLEYCPEDYKTVGQILKENGLETCKQE